MKIPIFEIIDGDIHYKIYENGDIKGFSEDAWIINRIPVKETYLQTIGLLKKNYRKSSKYKKFEEMLTVNQNQQYPLEVGLNSLFPASHKECQNKQR